MHAQTFLGATTSHKVRQATFQILPDRHPGINNPCHRSLLRHIDHPIRPLPDHHRTIPPVTHYLAYSPGGKPRQQGITKKHVTRTTLATQRRANALSHAHDLPNHSAQKPEDGECWVGGFMTPT
jgi:hypothetical protein